MRILIAGASLMLLVVAALLTSFVCPGPYPPDRAYKDFVAAHTDSSIP